MSSCPLHTWRRVFMSTWATVLATPPHSSLPWPTKCEISWTIWVNPQSSCARMVCNIRRIICRSNSAITRSSCRASCSMIWEHFVWFTIARSIRSEIERGICADENSSLFSTIWSREDLNWRVERGSFGLSCWRRRLRIIIIAYS